MRRGVTGMRRRLPVYGGPCALLLVLATGCIPPRDPIPGVPWVRHVIDDSSLGGDGVRLADVNADGRMDIATGWEEGGRVRVCLNPGPAGVRKRWSSVTVGKVAAPEDAVFVDLDADGAVDVVSACEGGGRSIWVHWAPRDAAEYLAPDAWQTEALRAARDARLWMFTVPIQLDGQHGVDLVAGAKGKDGRIGWFQSPADPRALDDWQWYPLYDAGWIMSLIAADMDGDSDLDVLTSDRRGPGRGCLWLENPGPGPRQRLPWTVHRIGGEDHEVMFLALIDLDRDGLLDVLSATKDDGLLYLRRRDGSGVRWQPFVIQLPAGCGTGKAVNVGDVDLDGRLDIVVTCEHAGDEKTGVFWMSYVTSVTDPVWWPHEISGPEGVKYDLVELLDLDDDGDLDVMTCEEATDLGVIWYENPARSPEVSPRSPASVPPEGRPWRVRR